MKKGKNMLGIILKYNFFWENYSLGEKEKKFNMEKEEKYDIIYKYFLCYDVWVENRSHREEKSRKLVQDFFLFC